VKTRAIRLEASSFCQLRCPSCPTTTHAARPAVGNGFLAYADLEKLLDENPELEEIELSNYGEAFLNPQLLQILELAHRRNVAVSIANGANFNNVGERVLKGLVEYQVRSITCSIDGATADTYQRYRIRGKFNRVIENIKTLNAIKARRQSSLPHLRWQFIVFGHNQHELFAARAMATELGMEFFAKLSWDDEFSPVQNVPAVRKDIDIGVTTRAEFKDRYGHDYAQSICHQLWDNPQINWDGKVLGCCRNFWADFGGNAFRDGLAACLNSEKLRYARDMLRGKVTARDDIPCTTCDIYLGMRASGKWLDRSARAPSFGSVRATVAKQLYWRLRRRAGRSLAAFMTRLRRRA
jgi:MoaA/NifB/PqqE/SkfB family radical SAM enzyme